MATGIRSGSGTNLTFDQGPGLTSGRPVNRLELEPKHYNDTTGTNTGTYRGVE